MTIKSTACDIYNTWLIRECAGMNLTIFEIYAKNSKMAWKFAKCFPVQKVSKYGVFFGPYFSVFELNTEAYAVTLPIESKYGKIRTRKTLRI